MGFNGSVHGFPHRDVINSLLVTLNVRVTFIHEQVSSASKLMLYIDIHTWNGYEYLLVNEEKAWHDAEAYCVDRGGHLTSITSQAEDDFLLQFTTQEYNNG